MSHKPFDQSADIYSFTFILWQLITGKEVWEDVKNYQQLTAKHLRHIRPDINSILPESLKMLIDQGWAVDPNERPTAHDIVDAMNGILIDIAIPDFNDQAKQFWKEHCPGEVFLC